MGMAGAVTVLAVERAAVLTTEAVLTVTDQAAVRSEAEVPTVTDQAAALTVTDQAAGLVVPAAMVLPADGESAFLVISPYNYKTYLTFCNCL